MRSDPVIPNVICPLSFSASLYPPSRVAGIFCHLDTHRSIDASSCASVERACEGPEKDKRADFVYLNI